MRSTTMGRSPALHTESTGHSLPPSWGRPSWGRTRASGPGPGHFLAQEHRDLVCGMNHRLVKCLPDSATRLDPAPVSVWPHCIHARLPRHRQPGLTNCEVVTTTRDPDGWVPGTVQQFWHRVIGEPRTATEDEEITRLELDVDPRPVPGGGIAKAEYTRLPQAERDNRRRTALVPVGVHPHPSISVIPVDECNVGSVGASGVRIPVGIGNRPPSDLPQLAREWRHLPSVTVIHGQAVTVGEPVPAETGHFHRHHSSGGHPWCMHPAGLGDPLPATDDQLPLGIEIEPTR